MSSLHCTSFICHVFFTCLMFIWIYCIRTNCSWNFAKGVSWIFKKWLCWYLKDEIDQLQKSYYRTEFSQLHSLLKNRITFQIYLHRIKQMRRHPRPSMSSWFWQQLWFSTRIVNTHIPLALASLYFLPLQPLQQQCLWQICSCRVGSFGEG